MRLQRGHDSPPVRLIYIDQPSRDRVCDGASAAPNGTVVSAVRGGGRSEGKSNGYCHFARILAAFFMDFGTVAGRETMTNDCALPPFLPVLVDAQPVTLPPAPPLVSE